MTTRPWREEELTGWGLRDVASCRTLAPGHVSDIAGMLERARQGGFTVGLRGSGFSYGDAALNEGGVVLYLSRLNHILEWDSSTGLVTAEPGVTIAQLWQHIISSGWWPSVVPGASAVTLGGAASSNVHGKNNWRIGCFGDYVLSFDLLLSGGQVLTCSREQHSDLFNAAIGGLGLFGVVTSLTIQARRIYSGRLAEIQRAYPSLDAMLAAVEEATYWATDIVGWVDTSATGAQLGRGLLKAGRDLLPGEDLSPEESLCVKGQYSRRLPQSLPSGLVPRLAKPMVSRPGVWAANRFQWLRGSRRRPSEMGYETYVDGNFPLDAIPNWRDTYRPRGLIQHQSMVPKETAASVFKTLLARSHAAGIVPSFAVLKKHRKSDFLMTYLVDGYSLALDYTVRRGQEAALLRLIHELNEVLLDHDGRCYFAKDGVLTAAQARRMYPAEDLARFQMLKQRYDPAHLFSSNLFRRVLV
ncbi:MAG: FAD-dependent oxidoreductase [Ktedonobacterales bacterium]